MSRYVASMADRELPSDPELMALQDQLGQCRACPQMVAPPVYGLPVRSAVMMVGQAPGVHEQQTLRPFAWTAGRRLFNWFDSVGVPERAFRRSVYMTAVCRCFPGKKPRGGDRVPDKTEIANCRRWLDAEFSIVRPRLVIPVGKLAIESILGRMPLAQAVGRLLERDADGRTFDVLALPHPSGASTWTHTEPGKSLLVEALGLLEAHPDWQGIRTKAGGMA